MSCQSRIVLNSLAFLLVSSFVASGAVAEDASFDAQMDAYLKDDEKVAKVGQALERYFMKRRADQQKQEEESEKKEMEEQFKNPISVEVGKSPSKGPETAPVTIVEFSDFQCPYCANAAKTMESLYTDYKGEVRIVFKNLPLPFHDKAKGAALAALAANRQGKFWEMHNLLFAKQSELGDELYPQLASELGLDTAKFAEDLKDPELAKSLEEDMALAQKLEVQGTPGFFVNGVRIKGALPAPHFKTIIDRWLTIKKEAKK